ncbi:MAG TPA: type II toxin-antitoxin system mRNA interferase toxin, RelE/StbE family [Patescibacteria group bacterium]
MKKSPLVIKIAFRKRLGLFLEEPFSFRLNDHSLTGKYLNYRSINITGDWRAIFEEFGEGEDKEVLFVALGTHSQLYK